ncbi:MAG TPA: VapC toxin family PIN domain ribonuclease, partial [Thermoanaerobaculia bacterium]|nr:VapC toxin family PIN domain ribonuclease [Thermoanaerobaculia bacterium]
MILVDTSVWVDHLRQGNTRLRDLLAEARVAGHPFVTGEVAMGHLRR